MLEEASGVDVVDCFKTFNKFKSKIVFIGRNELKHAVRNK